jgi:hypothetical protein
METSAMLQNLPANDTSWSPLDIAIARSMAEALKQKGALTHKQWELSARLFKKEESESQ